MELTKKIAKEIHEIAKNLDGIGKWKAYGREIAEKYQLTDREAIDILNNKNVTAIIKSIKEKNNKKIINTLNNIASGKNKEDVVNEFIQLKEDTIGNCNYEEVEFNLN